MTKNSINDQDIMNDMLKDSKFAIHSLVVALEESVTPDFRDKLSNLLNSRIDEHFQLSDLATKKNWYQPKLMPDQQLRQERDAISNIMQNFKF